MITCRQRFEVAVLSNYPAYRCRHDFRDDFILLYSMPYRLGPETGALGGQLVPTGADYRPCGFDIGWIQSPHRCR